METVFQALKRAASDLFTSRMLSLALLPMGAALLLWLGLAWWFGAAWKLALVEQLADTPVQALLIWIGVEWLAAYLVIFLLILLWLPAVYLTALLITALLLMPMIIDFVACRHYPGLVRQEGGTLAGSLLNGAVSTLLFLLAWLLLLPLWLFAPFGVMVSIGLNAWLNQRLFLYDALSEHASTEELDHLRETEGGQRYALGAILGLLHFVPLLNFLAPVYIGLAFTHFGLSALARQRGESTA